MTPQQGLLARIHKNRELKITVGRFVFTARRPTVIEAGRMREAGRDGPADLAADHVVDWSGVTEDDLVGGGGTDQVPFDERLWREWCADRPDLWQPISGAVLEAFATYAKAQKEAPKN